MKSERRHELQTNALADWLGTTIERVRPYETTLLGVALLAAMLAVAGAWWRYHSAAQAAEAWQGMLAGNPNVLFNLMEQHSGTPVGSLAGLVAGDYSYVQGVQQRFTNRAASNDALAKAADCYQRVLAADTSPMAQERATFGLARVLETLNKLPEAEQGYKSVKERWPHGEFAAWASRRLADLEKPATKEFYDEFARFDPKPSPAGGDMPGKSSLSKPDAPQEPAEEPLFRPGERFKLEGDEKESKDATTPAKSSAAKK